MGPCPEAEGASVCCDVLAEKPPQPERTTLMNTHMHPLMTFTTRLQWVAVPVCPSAERK